MLRVVLVHLKRMIQDKHLNKKVQYRAVTVRVAVAVKEKLLWKKKRLTLNLFLKSQLALSKEF